MEQTEVPKLRCQRIGCNATFTEDNNPDGSCTYHDSGPFFHDGMKEWSCCKKRSHDFSLFLEIPGCKTGKHTTEKPVLTKAKATPTPSPKNPFSPPIAAPATNTSSKESCLRCEQGFFCSDHGSQAQPKAAPAESNVSAPAKKVVDLNQPQTCKNQGCGQTFKEKDNHETACNYHPGPAVFHDRMRGWKCCDIHVKEFDEFVSIPPCSKGWHDADSAS
ncbi:PPHB SUSCEPTIBLE family protein [Salix suchowensis]|nr:PPHB SUSCEPTIBLE family protein [Salix suchowensis]